MALADLTDEDLQDKLTRAKAAGRGDLVTVAQAELRRRAQIAPEAAPEAAAPEAAPGISQTESALRGASQGATLNLGDEISGALSGIATAMSPHGGGFGEEISASIDRIRRSNKSAQMANPNSYLAGEVGSGLVTGGLGVGTAKAAASTARPLARLMGVGAVEGGVAGFGAAEGNPTERTLPATAGAATGALLAPVVGYGAETVGRGLSSVGRLLWSKLSDSPEQVARRAIREVLEAGEISQNDARILLDELGPRGMLADISPETQGMSSVVGQRRGGRGVAEEALTGRQLSQQDVINQHADDAMGDRWGGYYSFLDDLQASRRTQSREAYDAAYEIGIQPTEEMVRISRTKPFQDAAKEARQRITDKIDLDNQGVPGQDAGLDMMSTRFMDQIKRRLGAQERILRRSGDMEKAADVGNIRRAFVDELDIQNPRYAEARGIYAGGMELEEAAELGADLLKGNRSSRLVERELDGLTEGEMEAVRVGAFGSMLDLVERAGGTHNAVNRLVGSTRSRRILEQMFPDPETFADFIARMDNEANFTKTFNDTLRNSLTYGRKAAEESIEAAETVVGGLGEVAATGTPVGMVSRLASRMTRSRMGTDEYKEIARLLYKNVSDEELDRIFRSRRAPVSFTDDDLLGKAARSAGVSASNVGAGHSGRLVD